MSADGGMCLIRSNSGSTPSLPQSRENSGSELWKAVAASQILLILKCLPYFIFLKHFVRFMVSEHVFFFFSFTIGIECLL